jgi:hypothetical protein
MTLTNKTYDLLEAMLDRLMEKYPDLDANQLSEKYLALVDEAGRHAIRRLKEDLEQEGFKVPHESR